MSRSRRGPDEGPGDDPPAPADIRLSPRDPRNQPKSAWNGVRTCSRVSGGTCWDCKRQAFFSHHRLEDAVLCGPCFKLRYEPEVVAREAADRLAAATRRATIVNDERERRKAGLPPADGWKRQGNLLVEEIKNPVPGTICAREMIEVYPTLYDTEMFKPAVDGEKLSLFRNFESLTKKEKP